MGPCLSHFPWFGVAAHANVENMKNDDDRSLKREVVELRHMLETVNLQLEGMDQSLQQLFSKMMIPSSSSSSSADAILVRRKVHHRRRFHRKGITQGSAPCHIVDEYQYYNNVHRDGSYSL